MKIAIQVGNGSALKEFDLDLDTSLEPDLICDIDDNEIVVSLRVPINDQCARFLEFIDRTVFHSVDVVLYRVVFSDLQFTVKMKYVMVDRIRCQNFFVMDFVSRDEHCELLNTELSEVVVC